MKSPPVLLISALLLALMAIMVHSALVEHTFTVANTTVKQLCKTRVITAVNGQLPGPTIHARNGDTVAVHVINQSPYKITIHWHGIFQMLTAWADGPSYITQCPISPGANFTYRFNITGQEGTLWWHAHFSMLRATVYGALIIRPRTNKDYPFPRAHKEVPILLGEWWDANVVDVEAEAMAAGAPPNISDAFTINGRPGDLYNCSDKHIYKLKVEQGKTYMLRIINAALNTQLFFKIAGHAFTVVAADARYTTPYSTNVIAVAPGQTVDALMLAGGDVNRRYYMSVRAYVSSSVPAPFANYTTTAILKYSSSASSTNSPQVLPEMPAFNDTVTAHEFYSSLKGLSSAAPPVPTAVDEKMLIVFGFGVVPCSASQPACDRTRGALAASMNNVSFQFPSTTSLLESHFTNGGNGVYTADFPDAPPIYFDFTNTKLSLNPLLLFTKKGTSVKKLKFNATVEVVLQNTAVIGEENHPIHLHGFDFFVLGMGFGNYNATAAAAKFNLVNPQMRNTVAVPAGGWAVIRFVANNPGVWIIHCHLDAHLSSGLATAFVVENGGTTATTLPPPPSDYPKCS